MTRSRLSYASIDSLGELARPASKPFNRNCLVVAVQDEIRELIDAAARDAGWQTTVCEKPFLARQFAQRRLIQLAIVDLPESDSAAHDEFCALVEQIALTSKALLVVCGNDENPQEEVWARQLGIWMYLPGVQYGADFVPLCGEARRIVEDAPFSRRPIRRALPRAEHELKRRDCWPSAKNSPR